MTRVSATAGISSQLAPGSLTAVAEIDTQPVLEYSCHEGNLGLRNILSSARAEEKKAEEAAKAK